MSTYAGSGVGGFADGDATQAMFKFPTGLALDEEGNLLADYGNNRIRKITPDGTFIFQSSNSIQVKMIMILQSITYWK